MANLNVQVLREGTHSGSGGGVIHDPSDITEMLLARLRDVTTGLVYPPALQVKIPEGRIREATAMADLMPGAVFEPFSKVPGLQPATDDEVALILRQSWQAALTKIGIEGLPPIGSASPLIHPGLVTRLSMRLPPTLPAGPALDFIVSELTRESPYGAAVTVSGTRAADGWNSPEHPEALSALISGVSTAYWGQGSVAMGEGGTIPFMGMLGAAFPAAQFLITGVLGPHSNAHGPNEFLHIPYAKRLTAAVAAILAEMGLGGIV